MYCLQIIMKQRSSQQLSFQQLCVPSLNLYHLHLLIFIITYPKIDRKKFRNEMDLIASPSERFQLIINSAFQRHPVFLSLKNFSISKQLKAWKNRY